MKKKLIFIYIILLQLFSIYAQTRDEMGIFEIKDALKFNYNGIDYLVNETSSLYDKSCYITEKILTKDSVIKRAKISAYHKYLFLENDNGWISVDNCSIKNSDLFPSEFLFYNRLLNNNKYWIPKWYTSFYGSKYIDIVSEIEKNIPKLHNFYPDWNGDDASYWTSDFSCNIPFNISFTNACIVVESLPMNYFLIKNITMKNVNHYQITCLAEDDFSREDFICDYAFMNEFPMINNKEFVLDILFGNESIKLYNENNKLIVELVPVDLEWINQFSFFLSTWDENKLFLDVKSNTSVFNANSIILKKDMISTCNLKPACDVLRRIPGIITTFSPAK